MAQPNYQRLASLGQLPKDKERDVNEALAESDRLKEVNDSLLKENVRMSEEIKKLTKENDILKAESKKVKSFIRAKEEVKKL